MAVLFSDTTGSGEPVLVLLHGLGATGAAFRLLLEKLTAPFVGTRAAFTQAPLSSRLPRARTTGLKNAQASDRDEISLSRRCGRLAVRPQTIFQARADKDAGKITAAKILPLEQLALSPQCGFASTIKGNRLTMDDQKKKLTLVVETAKEVWGTV